MAAQFPSKFQNFPQNTIISGVKSFPISKFFPPSFQESNLWNQARFQWMVGANTTCVAPYHIWSLGHEHGLLTASDLRFYPKLSLGLWNSLGLDAVYCNNAEILKSTIHRFMEYYMYNFCRVNVHIWNYAKAIHFSFNISLEIYINKTILHISTSV